MEKTVILSLQLSYYGEFLTERQRTLLRQWVDEDLSLSEIAENEGISRQGVHDALKRAQAQLELFEKSLGLMRKEAQTKQCLVELRNCIVNCKDEQLKAQLLKQVACLESIWEETDGV